MGNAINPDVKRRIEAILKEGEEAARKRKAQEFALRGLSGLICVGVFLLGQVSADWLLSRNRNIPFDNSGVHSPRGGEHLNESDDQAGVFVRVQRGLPAIEGELHLPDRLF